MYLFSFTASSTTTTGLEVAEDFVFPRAVSGTAFLLLFGLVVVPFDFFSTFLEAVDVAVVFLTDRLLFKVDLFSGLTTVKARNSDTVFLL